MPLLYNALHRPRKGPLLGRDNPNHPNHPLNLRRQRAQQSALQEQQALRRALLEHPEELPVYQSDTLGALLQQYRCGRAACVCAACSSAGVGGQRACVQRAAVQVHAQCHA